jgi:hypothetical protein
VKAGSYYSIRFRNEGEVKLVSFTFPSMMEATQTDHLYKKETGEYQLERVGILEMKISEIAEKLKRQAVWDRVNSEVMIGVVKKYSGYQFVEMLVVVVVCAYQVHVVKRMFKTDSVL